MAGVHELLRFERKRTQPLDAEPHRLVCQSNVGKAIDNRDDLHFAANRGRHPGRYWNGRERR